MASIKTNTCSISKLHELLSLLLFEKSAKLIRLSIHSICTCVYKDVVTILIELNYLCDCYLYQVGCTVTQDIKILCYMFSIVILINLSLFFYVCLQAFLASLTIAQMLSTGQRKPSSSNHINCKSKLRLSTQRDLENVG